jgi:hypothetical protein
MKKPFGNVSLGLRYKPKVHNVATCRGKVVGFIMLLSFLGRVLVPLCAQDAEPGISLVLHTLGDLWEYEHAGRPPSQHISFELPEAYINMYLSESLKLKPRPGLRSLAVELHPGNRIVATAEVDVRRLMAADPAMIPSNLGSKLLGAGSLKAEFNFRVESGLLTFAVKPIASGGLDLPNPVLERIVRSIASIQPESLDTSRPITLPWGLKKLYTQARLLGGGT